MSGWCDSHTSRERQERRRDKLGEERRRGPVPRRGSGAPVAAQGRAGLKEMSLATPAWPIMEMAWSMPPDCVPTYFSHSAAKCATSCAAARARVT